MNYLIGDIGNTYIKLSVLNDNLSIKKIYNIKTIDIINNRYKRNFFTKLNKKKFKKNILFSSVVPKAFKKIKSILTRKNFKVLEIKNLKIKKILKIKIKNYDQLGSDRISNALGSLIYKNTLVIDFGTATTFDIIEKGPYEGGVISPGVNLSISNLNKSTALLPLLNLKNAKNIYGKNTQEALNAGFIWGYQGLINNIIKKISSKRKKNYKIILTGGYAKLFRKHIKYKTLIDQNITIKGIIKAYKELL